MRPIDITFTNSQFKSLVQYVKPGNVLSPLPDPATSTVTGRLTNREVVQSDGKLHEDIAKILSVLENPTAMVNLKCLNTKQLMDVYWYTGRENVIDGLVSLANHDGEIRLQAPSPEEEYLFKMRAMLGPEPVKYVQVKGALDVTAAWLLWILLDEQRKGHKAVKSEDIRERLENPFDGLADLGAYFCHTLDLLPPSRSEITKGLASLAAHNIIQETAKGIILSADLGELALDLKVVRAHVHFAVKQFNRAGEVESLRYWALQGKSGAMLLWYEVDGDVVFRVVTPAVFHELIIRLLKIQPVPAAQPPAVPTAAPAGGKTLRYEPLKTKQKSAAGRMLTSFLIGLFTIAVGLFTTGYLTYTPGKGVDLAAEIASTPTAEVETAPTSAAAEPSAQDIEVDSINVVPTSDYVVSVFGRLQNNGASAVGTISLDIDLLDSSGNVVQTISGWSMTDSIAAGGEGYFMAEAYELTELPASATATITYAAPSEVDSTVALAEVRGKQVTPIEYYAEIIGDAFNTSDQPVEILSVIGILLDANGHVIGMGRSDDFDIALRSGEYMPVKVSVSASAEIAAQAADSLLLVETAPLNTLTDPPLALSTEKEIFRTPDGFFYISEMMNNSSQTLRVEGLVAAFYDADGNLLDVARSWDTRYIEPGAISPFIVEEFNRLNLEENQGVSPASYLIVVPQMATTTLDAGLLTLDTEVINTNQYLPDQWYLVHGNVINNTSEMIAYGTVTVNLRDPATGKLKSTYYYPFSGLASGASTEFVVYLPLPPGVDPAVMTQEIRAVGTP